MEPTVFTIFLYILPASDGVREIFSFGYRIFFIAAPYRTRPRHPIAIFLMPRGIDSILSIEFNTEWQIQVHVRQKSTNGSH